MAQEAERVHATVLEGYYGEKLEGTGKARVWINYQPFRQDALEHEINNGDGPTFHSLLNFLSQMNSAFLLRVGPQPPKQTFSSTVTVAFGTFVFTF